jgi:adenylate cyclase
VAQTDGDLYGDGVNIAARLESIANPGGIAISGKVYEELQGKVSLVFEDRGEQSLKNVARPVRVYALGGSALDANAIAKPLPLPDKPSIAVLPFTNMSGDPEQEYFADGVVEDIITALSKVSGFFVIARNSSFAYRDKAAEVRQIGRELGVRYVLEGSVRKSGNRVRLTGQLIEAETGHHIWADRFDGALDDIFALQDEVTAKVVRALAPTLVRAEIERTKRKPTESLDAYEHFLRGLAVVYSGWTREARDSAFEAFTRAIELDPQFARAYAGAAMIYVGRKDNNWMVDRPREFAEGLRLARRAVELGKEDALALCYGGWTLVHLARNTEVGAPFIERALVLDPNMTAARVYSAWLRIWTGEPEIAIERIAEAIRLSPLDPELHFWEIAMAHGYYHAERYGEAVAWAVKGAAVDPTYVGGLRILAASYARAGRTEDAQAAVQRLYEIDPTLCIANLRDAVGPYRPEGLARYEEGLRLAGLPE